MSVSLIIEILFQRRVQSVSVGGNVDLALAGNILIGSVPGVIVGSHFAAKAPTAFLRTALGIVLIASGVVTVQKGDPMVWPIAALVAGIGLSLLIWFPRWWNRRRVRREGEQERDRSGDLAPDVIG